MMPIPKKTDAEKEAARVYAEQVEAITVLVYCARLEADSPGAVLRMVDKDEDGGKKLRGRAMSYLPIVRATLNILDAPDHVAVASRGKAF